MGDSEEYFKNKMKKRKFSFKVVLFSLIALGFLTLTFLADWKFIIGAVVFMILNQRELMGKKR